MLLEVSGRQVSLRSVLEAGVHGGYVESIGATVAECQAEPAELAGRRSPIADVIARGIPFFEIALEVDLEFAELSVDAQSARGGLNRSCASVADSCARHHLCIEARRGKA